MNLHEHQAKILFSDYGIPVPDGRAVFALDEVDEALKSLGGDRWVVKAQVHAGGRGKAGGVKIVDNKAAVKTSVESLLEKKLVTHQTGAEGQFISRVLIEKSSDIDREFYLACLVERTLERVVFVVSAEGGMDIEEVARKTPEKIIKAVVDPAAGLQAYQCRDMAFTLGLEGDQVKAFSAIARNLYRLFCDRDLSLLEINPLVVTKDGELLALDAKISVDDSALYRQKSLLELRDVTQDDEKEIRAQEFDLSYVALDGEIGCMVNGAGLAMATMDLIKLHGGNPANFLDVGGGATAERVAEALRIILSDKKVKAVLVNIFGGIVHCDLIAEGIISAVKDIHTTVPITVRLEGTNAEKGLSLLEKSDLSIQAVADLTDAAKQAIKAASG